MVSMRRIQCATAGSEMQGPCTRPRGGSGIKSAPAESHQENGDPGPTNKMNSSWPTS